jgi:hypothetical protein
MKGRDNMDKRTNAEKALDGLAEMAWASFAKAMDAVKAADARAAREAERVYAKGKTLLVVRGK